ncbi:MAG: hypothetical protein H0X49_08435 [Acidobacteria bacterium]|nr:hypothetical protein [Acidobacteriota bacterium]
MQRVSEEIAHISKRNGRWVIHPRKLQVVTVYNFEGKRTDETFHVRIHGNQSDLDSATVMQDADGNITGYSSYFEGILQYKVFFAYNEQGRKIEEITYDAKGELCRKTYYKYDTHRKMIEMSAYNSDNTLQDKHTYTNEYDSAGNLVKITIRRWTNIDGEMFYEPLCEIYYNITYY